MKFLEIYVNLTDAEKQVLSTKFASDADLKHFINKQINKVIGKECEDIINNQELKDVSNE